MIIVNSVPYDALYNSNMDMTVDSAFLGVELLKQARPERWRSAGFSVQSNKKFSAFELVKVVAGVITKLTAAPADSDNLAFVSFNLDNLTATVANKRQPFGTVWYGVDGVNEETLIYPSNVAWNDTIRAILAKQGIFTCNRIPDVVPTP